MAKRVFLIVLDSVGIGELPDAAEYGDEGSNTLKACYDTGKLVLPNLERLGLFHIDGNAYGKRTNAVPTAPIAKIARLRELSKGKDTTTGHWEMMGLVSERPFPTYPEGFPPEIVAEFERKTGRKTLCNRPYSGTRVIADYGEEHIRTGALIVYTSADSVFQIAAHEDVVPVEELYRYCEIAREILRGEHAVGRVIARPFEGDHPYRRTPRRHDFSLPPPKETSLNRLSAGGYDVIGVGKIYDIFAGKGLTESFREIGNEADMRIASELQARDFRGLCFINLVDFDMLYGHRNDVAGYTAALNRFDEWLGGFIGGMRADDVLMITADHGCDPSTPSTDHSREYVPLLLFGEGIAPGNLGTLDGFARVGETAEEMLKK
ncbi:MAG: phosphopentomutase [Bacteroides sp.]|nr:phosphopentomutase [Eubacterium sp.]MCM1418866.1 phosphopentomutase [Roseburia sp.]MCM1463331.1 phosphopentomutase [Bacteroides sp.]